MANEQRKNENQLIDEGRGRGKGCRINGCSVQVINVTAVIIHDVLLLLVASIAIPSFNILLKCKQNGDENNVNRDDVNDKNVCIVHTIYYLHQAPSIRSFDTLLSPIWASKHVTSNHHYLDN